MKVTLALLIIVVAYALYGIFHAWRFNRHWKHFWRSKDSE
jgi:hypothetical protein